jgi:hypothetical protein
LSPQEKWPAWSAGEVLAVAVILNDTAILDAMEYTKAEALDRLRWDIQEPTVDAAAAVFDRLREQLDQQADPMPVFPLKAKDKLAVRTIESYRTYCEDEGLDAQADEVSKAIDEFEAWQARHPNAMKLPDHVHVPASAD